VEIGVRSSPSPVVLEASFLVDMPSLGHCSVAKIAGQMTDHQVLHSCAWPTAELHISSSLIQIVSPGELPTGVASEPFDRFHTIHSLTGLAHFAVEAW
jgi:hypothetical protein